MVHIISYHDRDFMSTYQILARVSQQRNVVVIQIKYYAAVLR